MSTGLSLGLRSPGPHNLMSIGASHNDRWASKGELNDACFVVRDANGQQLAYVYFENEPGRRSAATLLTKDEARRIAANIAKLPDRKATRIRAFDG